MKKNRHSQKKKFRQRRSNYVSLSLKGIAGKLRVSQAPSADARSEALSTILESFDNLPN
ncbi:hypothetical protein ABDK00_001585 [Niabella insulamsoli]|uniref:hypothetical protein n=1 Tax=Niabella insulamsoli TaxID=3144874 RepID=UPI0031FBD4BB